MEVGDVQILVVEDDPRMATLLQQGLEEEGHRVVMAADGLEGLAMAQSAAFDAIILDVMLPRLDGVHVALRLRELSNQTPVLMLTARDGLSDVVKGLDAGADDYLTKPFSFEILLARLRSVSRRGPIPQPLWLTYADLRLDLATRKVTRAGRPISLTPREFSLLELLLRNARRVVRRETILAAVWGFDSDVGENTLEAFVRLLRNKIDSPFDSKLIHTIRGVGYCLRLPEA
jgi:DNA-binding response OmpR family regulator